MLSLESLLNRCFFKHALVLACMICSQSVSAQVTMGFAIWDLVTADECKETMSFLGQNEYLIENGDHMMTKAYEFNRFRRTDFYVFSQRTTSNNNIPNCSGYAGSPPGTKLKVYAKFNDDFTEMSFYLEPIEAQRLDIVYLRRPQKVSN